MSDYISREDALSAQNKSMNLSEMRKRLERIPPADVRPVVKGKWIRQAVEEDAGWVYTVYRCECCNAIYGREYPFCPNCGASMREGCK